MDDFEILIFKNKDMVKAAQFGRFDLVQELIKKHDVKPDFQVLEAAVSEGHTRIVDYLLTECGLYPKKKIVYTATRKNYMGIMYRLLKDTRVNANIIFYNSLYAGNVEMVDYLLKNNYIDDPVKAPVDVDWKTHYDGRNGAIITAVDKGLTDIVRVMLENEKIRSNLEPKIFLSHGFKHESVGKLLWPYLKDQITDNDIHDCMRCAIRMDLDSKCLDFLFDKLNVPISLDVAERILKESESKNYFDNRFSIYFYDEYFDEDNTFRYFLKRITPPILGQLFDRYMENILKDIECFSPDLVLSLIDNGLELTTERFIGLIHIYKQLHEYRETKIYLLQSIFVKFVDDPRVDPTYDDHYLFWISVYNEKNERVMKSLLKRISNIPRNFRERIDLRKLQPKIIVCLARAGCYPLNELFRTNSFFRWYDQQYLLRNLLKFPGLAGERPNYPEIWSEVMMKEQETLKKIKILYKHLVGTSPVWLDLFRQILEYLPEVMEDSSLEGTKTEVIDRWIKLCL